LDVVPLLRGSAGGPGLEKKRLMLRGSAGGPGLEKKRLMPKAANNGMQRTAFRAAADAKR